MSGCLCIYINNLQDLKGRQVEKIFIALYLDLVFCFVVAFFFYFFFGSLFLQSIFLHTCMFVFDT